MALPADIIDYILSLLQSDLASLKACSQSHPTIYSLSERYLYANISLHDGYNDTIPANDKFGLGLHLPTFIQVLAHKPYLTNYVRSLTVNFKFNALKPSMVDCYLKDISSILLFFPMLRKIGCCNIGSSKICIWDALPGRFCDAFVDCAQLKSIEEVFIGRIVFPLSLLNGSQTIKSLTLYQCKVVYYYPGQAQGDLPRPPIDRLAIQDCKLDVFSVQSILTWIEACGLRDLKISDTQAGQPQILERLIPRLLSSCLNTLTDLCLDLETAYLSSFALDSNSELITQSTITPDPSVLVSLPHLQHLTIYATAVLFREPRFFGHRSPVPAITYLLTISSNSLRTLRLGIDFFFIFPAKFNNTFPPANLIWSPFIPLAAKCSSHLTTLDLSVRFMTQESEDKIYMPVSLISSSIAGCGGLAPYLEKNVLNITPKDS